MLFTNVLTYAIALAAAAPTVTALYNWDPLLQVYTLGDIPDGGYGCGNFGIEGTIIYKCVKTAGDEQYWLKKHKLCAWYGQAGGQCVKNQLRKGAKFYPFVSGSEVVCVHPVSVNGVP
jgi:hypothetical protein